MLVYKEYKIGDMVELQYDLIRCQNEQEMFIGPERLPAGTAMKIQSIIIPYGIEAVVVFRLQASAPEMFYCYVTEDFIKLLPSDSSKVTVDSTPTGYVYQHPEGDMQKLYLIQAYPDRDKDFFEVFTIEVLDRPESPYYDSLGNGGCFMKSFEDKPQHTPFPRAYTMHQERVATLKIALAFDIMVLLDGDIKEKSATIGELVKQRKFCTKQLPGYIYTPEEDVTLRGLPESKQVKEQNEHNKEMA